jgi:hypothetical protein
VSERGGGERVRDPWRDRLHSVLDSRVAMLVEAYGDDPATRGILKEIRGHYVKSRGRPKLTQTADEQLRSIEVFFTFECLAAIAVVAPRLRRLRDEIDAEAIRDPRVVSAWAAADPSTIDKGVPPLPQGADFVSVARNLAPDLEDGADSIGSVDPVSPFELGRWPGLHGFDALIRGRDEAALHRLAEEAGGIDPRTATIDAFEEALFAHYRREATRAAHPFGVTEQAHRDALVLAIAMIYEAHTAGELDGHLPAATRGRATSAALRDAFRATLDGLPFRRGRLQRIGELDLVRAAATVQLRFDAAEADEWHPVLRDVAGPPRSAFAAARWRLLPYSREFAEWLASVWPVGSPRQLAESLGRRDELRDFLGGVPEYEIYVGRTRASLLDRFWKARLRNEHDGTEPSVWHARSVHRELRIGLDQRKLDWVHVLRRPFEPAAVRGRDHAPTTSPDVQVDGDAGVRRTSMTDAFIARERRAETTDVAWVDDFLSTLPTTATWWVAARRSSWLSEPPSADLRRLALLESFLVFLHNNRDDTDVREGFGPAVTSWAATVGRSPVKAREHLVGLLREFARARPGVDPRRGDAILDVVDLTTVRASAAYRSLGPAFPTIFG